MGSWRGRACVLQNVWFLLGDQDMESAEGAGSASDVGAAGELGSFFHGENLGFDVAVDFGFILQFAAVGGDFAFDFAIDFDFACCDVAFDVGVLADGDAAFVGDDFAIDFSVDDHVVGEADGTGDFDSAGEDISRVGHGGRNGAKRKLLGNRKAWRERMRMPRKAAIFSCMWRMPCEEVVLTGRE